MESSELLRGRFDAGDAARELAAEVGVLDECDAGVAGAVELLGEDESTAAGFLLLGVEGGVAGAEAAAAAVAEAVESICIALTAAAALAAGLPGYGTSMYCAGGLRARGVRSLMMAMLLRELLVWSRAGEQR